MKGKNVAASVATILSALLFIVIGSCFSAFVYKREIIKVEDPKLFVVEGISIFSSEGDKNITSLEFSDMKLGLKPATGEEDAETNIPSTVTDKKGSEGQYAVFKAYAPAGSKVVIKNIKIDSKQDAEKVNKERENIFVAIKELKSKAQPLKENEVIVGNISASDERQKLTFLIWLSGKAQDALKGSTISFEVYFEALT